MSYEMSSRKRICVFGCDELGAYMHRFPHPIKKPDMFRMWLAKVGNRLEGRDQMKIYLNKRVCDYHFVSHYKTTGHRLTITAVPTQYLEGAFKENISSIEIEHNYCVPRVYASSGSLVDHTNRLQTEEVNMGSDRVPHLHPLDQPSTSKSKLNEDTKRSTAFYIKKYKTSQKEARRLKFKLKKSRTTVQHFKTRLANAEKISYKMAFDKITKKMTFPAKVFTSIQFNQTYKKPKGRRFNLEEKVMSLSLYKKSPKTYKLLSKMFTLPSSKSLKNLLKEIKVGPGINTIIFEKLKETVEGLNIEDRLCTLIFDEMSLTPQVYYNAATDEIKGFADGDDLKIANHVLVFMIKGIKRNFKQPVAFYFTQNITKIELKNTLKNVIKHIQRTGLKVLCTVCDQSTVNVSTINSLVQDTKEEYIRNQKQWKDVIFEINNQKIVPLYDVPHLLKGIRNNVLTKDMKYNDIDDDNKEKILKWNYFKMLYEADKTYGELRYLQKLTEEHVIPEKIKKMRVKMAAQIFSHSVAVATEHLTARENLPMECRDLIPIVLLLDHVFDSLNSSTFHIPNGKVYRGPVKRHSPHHNLWKKAIRVLKTVKFLQKKKEGNKVRIIENSAPSVLNFIKTLEGIQLLWKILNEKYGLDCMLTRNFNQDPIENFFGSIRSLGARNISPNSVAFEGAFKTLLLNNYSSTHSINSNCEADFNSCLQTLQFFITEKEKYKSPTTNIQQTEAILDENMLIIENANAEEDPGNDQAQYVCGWVLTKCLKNVVKQCKVCREKLILKEADKGNAYIRAKEYNRKKQWLCYPSDELFNCFRDIQNITTTNLKGNLRRFNNKKNIKMLTETLINFPCDCVLHKEIVKEYFIDKTINILIYSWTRSVNRILSGKVTYDLSGDDPLKRDAQIYFNKHKNKKY